MPRECNSYNHYECPGTSFKNTCANPDVRQFSPVWTCQRCGGNHSGSLKPKKCTFTICGTCGKAWMPVGPCNCTHV